MTEEQAPRINPTEEEEARVKRNEPQATGASADGDLHMPAVNDRTYSRLGMLVLLISFGGFGLWSAMAPLDSAVVAPGQVQVESNRKTVQHLEGGLVKEIAVDDGDTVKKGQLLLALDDTQTRAQLDILRWQFYNEQAKLARLKAERDHLESPSFPEQSIPEADRSQVHELQQQEARLFKFRRESLEAEIKVLEQRKAELLKQIEGLKAVAEIKKQRIALFKGEIEERESLYKRQLADKVQLRQLQHQKLALEGEVTEHNADIARLEVQASETQSKIRLRRQQFMTDVLQQLRDTQAALADKRIRIASLQDRLARTTIRAPADGIVVGMKVHTIGAVLSPGQPILNIVPQTERFVVKARVATTDIDRVQANELADIRFSAFDTRKTHVIEGRVKRVSADSYVDDRTNSAYYEAVVEVTQAGREQMKADGIQLLSGMPAEVMIKISGRTLLEYIIQPFSDMLARSFKEE